MPINSHEKLDSKIMSQTDKNAHTTLCLIEIADQYNKSKQFDASILLCDLALHLDPSNIQAQNLRSFSRNLKIIRDKSSPTTTKRNHVFFNTSHLIDQAKKGIYLLCKTKNYLTAHGFLDTLHQHDDDVLRMRATLFAHQFDLYERIVSLIDIQNYVEAFYYSFKCYAVTKNYREALLAINKALDLNQHYLPSIELEKKISTQLYGEYVVTVIDPNQYETQNKRELLPQGTEAQHCKRIKIEVMVNQKALSQQYAEVYAILNRLALKANYSQSDMAEINHWLSDPDFEYQNFNVMLKHHNPSYESVTLLWLLCRYAHEHDIFSNCINRIISLPTQIFLQLQFDAIPKSYDITTLLPPAYYYLGTLNKTPGIYITEQVISNFMALANIKKDNTPLLNWISENLNDVLQLPEVTSNSMSRDEEELQIRSLSN